MLQITNVLFHASVLDPGDSSGPQEPWLFEESLIPKVRCGGTDGGRRMWRGRVARGCACGGWGARCRRGAHTRCAWRRLGRGSGQTAGALAALDLRQRESRWDLWRAACCRSARACRDAFPGSVSCRRGAWASPLGSCPAVSVGKGRMALRSPGCHIPQGAVLAAPCGRWLQWCSNRDRSFRVCGSGLPIGCSWSVLRASGSSSVSELSFLTLCLRSLQNVRCQPAEDHQALDVAHGVPPPRAAPPLLRRVVLSCLCLASTCRIATRLVSDVALPMRRVSFFILI